MDTHAHIHTPQAACGYASEVISLVPDSDLVSKATSRPQPMPTPKSGVFVYIQLCAVELVCVCMCVHTFGCCIVHSLT